MGRSKTGIEREELPASHIHRISSSSPSPQAFTFPRGQIKHGGEIPPRLAPRLVRHEGRGESDYPGRNAEAKADTYENRTGYANDGGWGKQRQKRNDGHIATDETRNSPAVFKQPTAYQDDMTMRCGRARRGGIKSKQHTRRRERSGMITHHADMKTPSTSQAQHRPLHAPRPPYRENGAKSDEPTTSQPTA